MATKLNKFQSRERLSSAKMNLLVDAVNEILASGKFSPQFTHEGNKLYVSFD